jgi:glycosyltransferase involved in cell wall biosynthesis
MIERPVFTISTSFYRRGNWVEHVYETLKAQTYPYWEWVVTDDFSDELNAEEQLKKIAKLDPRVKYYTQSRKKELFYNPQYGSSGNIVMQLDSDDEIYVNLLEIYAKYFTENPDIMGITCGHIMKRDLKDYVSISSYALENKMNINFAPMGRAWRNIIPHFDYNGELNWWQNDTNIMRHIEARGKVLFLPRELYNYNYSVDSISKRPYTLKENDEIEKERLDIEGKFPDLMKGDKCTFDLRYLSINRLTWAFYTTEFVQSSTRKRVNFIKRDIRPYEKQLLSELFYDHSLIYNGDNRESYDEIVAFLNEGTYKYLIENINQIREFNPNISFRFFIDSTIFSPTPDQLKIFGRYSFWNTGGLIHGYIL